MTRKGKYLNYITCFLVQSGFFIAIPFAHAHVVTTGMGPVYDGIGHLLLTPEDLIPAMAVALYAGLRGKDPGRQTLFLLVSQYKGV
jgi:hypothetical protein